MSIGGCLCRCGEDVLLHEHSVVREIPGGGGSVTGSGWPPGSEDEWLVPFHHRRRMALTPARQATHASARPRPPAPTALPAAPRHLPKPLRWLPPPTHPFSPPPPQPLRSHLPHLPTPPVDPVPLEQVLTTFQPIAVSRFGWAEPQLAAVNFCSAAASIAVSLASAHLRLPEWTQVFTPAPFTPTSWTPFTPTHSHRAS